MFELPNNDLIDDLDDQEFAHGYLNEQANMRIAAQVRVLRMQREWTQEQLAAAAGMAQERVSKIERGDFDSLTLHTLRKLSFAFDVHLTVAFTRVSASLIDLCNLSRSRLEVESRSEDLETFSQQKPPAYFSVNVATSFVRPQLPIVPNNASASQSFEKV